MIKLSDFSDCVEFPADELGQAPTSLRLSRELEADALGEIGLHANGSIDLIEAIIQIKDSAELREQAITTLVTLLSKNGR